MVEKSTLALWTIVDPDGDAEYASDREAVIERYNDNIANYEADVCRIFPVKLLVTLPTAPDDAEEQAPKVDIADDAGEVASTA